MAELWLHIGTQKTGSTSIQHFGRDQAAFLAEQDVEFIGLGKRSSLNRLAKAMRTGNQSDAQELGAWAEAGIAQSRAKHVVLSSELFSANGIDLDQLKTLLPSLTQMRLHIVIYVRRQDKFHESLYSQRVKNGRNGASFEDYFTGSRDAYGDFARIVDAWRVGFPEAEIHVRRFERSQMKNGDVVSDFMSLLDVLDLPKLEEPVQSNVKPGVELLTVLMLMKRTKKFDVARMRREIEDRCDVPGTKARLMCNRFAREIVDHYAEGNEALRARYFPQDASLFDMSDIAGEAEPAAPFTEAQQAVIQAMLEAIVASDPKLVRA